MSANRLALALRVPSGRITSILNGKRVISADTALRLARHLGTSAQFWLNLQTRHDLAVAERDHGARIAAEVDRAAWGRADGRDRNLGNAGLSPSSRFDGTPKQTRYDRTSISRATALPASPRPPAGPA